uniref:Beta-galactosidase-1-like protein 2 n=1 Tax=Magallana gigas TaxID=29159 RepID=K1QB02_MAGGI
MKPIQIKVKHVVRLVIILFIAVIIWFAGVPSFRHQKFVPMPQNEIQKIYKKIKDGNGKLYQSEGSLRFKNRQFYLDGKPFRIFSGAFHYFRVLPQYWNETFLKMKASGLNTVETYVAWNFHEEIKGSFNFVGNKGLLNVREFIETAKSHGLFVILRPGPYICAEWEFGGLPSWLLRDTEMKVRSNYEGYLSGVDTYFAHLIPHIQHLQMMKKHGVVEMFFTSDPQIKSWKNGLYPIAYEALPTVNFKHLDEGGQELVDFIEGLELKEILTKLLDSGASINFYMFRGGTNFGFMNGAKIYHKHGYKPVVTSYDYMAPLSEAGDTTEKYQVIRELLMKYQENVRHFHGATLKEIPENKEKAAYGTFPINTYLSFEDLLSESEKIESKMILTMEHLTLYHGSGQNYGYILYRKILPKTKTINIKGIMQDRMQVFWNGKEIAAFDWTENLYQIHLDLMTDINIDEKENKLDLLVENLGRVNVRPLNEQFKGIMGEVFTDGSKEELKDWVIYPLDFRSQFLNSVWIHSHYKQLPNFDPSPALYSAEFDIEGTPKDTYLSMEGWTKGIVFINSFNLGRYWKHGPQQRLYVPGSILQNKKANTIRIFEQKKAGKEVVFYNSPTPY